MSFVLPGGTAPNWKVSVWAALAPAGGASETFFTVTLGGLSSFG